MIGNITVALIVVCLVLWFRWRRSKFQFFKELGIPGPEPSVLFGNMWEMYKKTPVQCKREWIQKYGRVVGYYFGLEPVLLVVDVDLMKQILVKEFHSFTDRPVRIFTLRDEEKPLVRHVINNKGQHWKRTRTLLTPSFTTGKLKMMAPLMNSALQILLDKLKQRSGTGEEFDIYNLYKTLTMDVIGRTAFGIDSNVQDNADHPLMGAAKALFEGRFKSLMFIFMFSFRELSGILLPVATFRLVLRSKGVNPISQLIKICNDVIKLRKEDPSLRRPDLLQTMIDARADDGKEFKVNKLAQSVEDNEDHSGDSDAHSDSGEKGPGKKQSKLTDEEVTGNSFVFFLAGYETTSTALSFITHVLVNRQEDQEKLRAEIKEKIGNDKVDYDAVQRLSYMDRFVMECLRMYPPIYAFVNRVTNRQVQLGKWTLPADLAVQIPVRYLHRDPELWSEPDKFDADRFLPENRSRDHSIIWQPFGAGPRNCIGMRLALLEIKLALGRILSEYKILPGPNTEKEHELDICVTPAILRPNNGIHVRVQRISA